MSVSARLACVCCLTLATSLTATWPLASSAAEEPKPPTLSRVFPAGGQAGTTVKVIATGEFPSWPVSTWSDRGLLAWKPLEEAGHFEVTIPSDNSLGVHHVRMHDAAGATVVKRFLVGNVPQSEEVEPNDTLADAMPLEQVPHTVAGVLEKSGDVDSFRIQLQAGETLVAALEANRLLGSPVDAVLELVDERGGYLARNLDATGLDPRIAATAVRDGVHVLRVYGFPADPNSTIGLAGSADSLYQLTLTKTGFLSGTLPTVSSSSRETPLAPRGWNLPESLSPQPVAASDASATWVGFPGVAGVIEVPTVAMTALPIAPADGSPGEPLSPPFVASGQFTQAHATHLYMVDAVKDKKLQVRLASQQAGFEADPLLVIRQADGTSVQAKTERDASFSWTVPADGRYTFEVRDRRGQFGPGFLYRLSVEPETPRFTATVAADQFTAKAGVDVAIEIAIARTNGFAEPIEFALAAGPEGVTAEPVTSVNEGDAAKKVTLTLRAAAATSGPLQILSRPQAPEGASPASVTPVVFGGHFLRTAWLTVTPAPSETPPAEPAPE